MRRPTTMTLGVMLAAVLALAGITMLPERAQGASAGNKDVVLMSCKNERGSIRTSAISKSAGVWGNYIERNECAESVANLLRAGFDLEHQEVIDVGSRESFSFLFVRK